MESNYAEENVSTEQPPPREKARVQGENGDEERPRRAEAPPRERTQEINGSPLLSRRLPKAERLLKPPEFRRVYGEGRRIEGRFMTVFILPGAAGFHRLGVTASKKAIGGAVERNRAKRRLRALANERLPQGGRAGTDYVLIGRQATIKRPFDLLRQDLDQALQSIERARR